MEPSLYATSAGILWHIFQSYDAGNMLYTFKPSFGFPFITICDHRASQAFCLTQFVCSGDFVRPPSLGQQTQSSLSSVLLNVQQLLKDNE